MKNIVIAIIVIVLIILGFWWFWQSSSYTADDIEDTDTSVPTRQLPGTDSGPTDEGQDLEDEGTSVLGTSVNDREIIAYHYGNGDTDTELLFVGGIHGMYSWNTTLVAYELIDYLEENPDVIPENVRVSVIPVLNPDGLYEAIGGDARFTKSDVPTSEEERIAGRFNANGVDLNRNFDCDWQSEGVWQSRAVDGGDEVFSEPESVAVRDYIQNNRPDAVVVWYSAAGGVFASSCHNGVLAETTEITNVYADASGYPAYESFDFYKITGDMVNWLAKENIPAISVLLTNHEDVEWDKNKAGIEALFAHYAE